MEEKPDTPPAEAFQQVLKGLLRPLVRAMIAEGVTAPALYRMVKEVYVETAERHFTLDDARATDSRISLLTGVHRRDVKSIRSGEPTGEGVRRTASAFATLLARWRTGVETTGPDGAPLALPRAAEKGPSFDRLAADVSTDIRPRTMLDELVRQGLVTVDGEMVSITEGAVVGPVDQAQKIHFFAENIGDHIAAAVDNLLSKDPRFIERAVFYNRLTSESVDTLEAEARRLGAGVLEELNAQAHARQTADLDDPEGTERFRFGVFFWREDEGAGGEGAGPTGDAETKEAGND